MLQTTRQQQRQQKFKFDQVMLNGMWDYLELDNYGQLNADNIATMLGNKHTSLSSRMTKYNVDQLIKVKEYLKYYNSVMKAEKTKVIDWIQKKQKNRNIRLKFLQTRKKQPKSQTTLPDVCKDDPPENVPDDWLETPSFIPLIQNIEKTITKTMIMSYIDNELKALQDTFMFASLDTEIQKLYGPINYWMLTCILSKLVSSTQQTKTQQMKTQQTKIQQTKIQQTKIQQTNTQQMKKQRIRLFLLSKLMYEQIFKFWDNIQWGEELKKIVVPSPPPSVELVRDRHAKGLWVPSTFPPITIPTAYKTRYNEIIRHTKDTYYVELVKDITLEDVIDYLLAMQQYETVNTLTPQQQNCLNQIKEKALYPLLYSKFFQADLPIQQVDSETVKTIKRKLHKLKCGFLPRWLCNFLFNSLNDDDKKYKYFKTLLKQGYFGKTITQQISREWKDFDLNVPLATVPPVV